MSFRGLFVGIDRYESPQINWLSCARRDATALHALFTDTLGGNSVLLTDEQATRAVIEKEFSALSACESDDVVVIAFSGHGTPTHELVTYDAQRSDLASTCVPLETLTEWFSLIPAQRLVCILDCCFSGGMGAKVLQVDAVPRSLISTDNLLNQLEGKGRLILTASLATEEAWENPKLGHGLLTFNIIEGLQGAEDIRKDGKIPVYRLLEFVTRRVVDAAKRLGKVQQPTLRGQIDGEFIWPLFHPGKLYEAAFPIGRRTKVTSDIHSLASYGFPQTLLDAWAGSIPSLNQLQIDAINDFKLFEGDHLVVSAPTSSGKTLVGELASLKAVLERKRSCFLLPLKALVNDKFRHFNQVYGKFGLRTIRATGESTSDDILALMRGQYDICLMTYEKFTALALGTPHILDQIATIVVDEVQMIADETRGVNLEFILTLLKMRRRQGAEPQLIALSAVIGDTNGLERWLGARLLKRSERPIPLDEGIIRADGGFHFIASDTNEEKTLPVIRPELRKGSSQDIIIPLVRKLVGEGKRVIVFRETKGEARSCALYLAQALGLPPARLVLDALPAGDPSLASDKLREALAGGVAFHISDLEPEERSLIEEQFRANPSALRVIAATTTLAMGVNTPAEAVIIAGLDHPGDKPYSIAEYKNIAGRAGRLGHSDRGTSYLVVIDAREEHHAWAHYVRGTPENLISRFLANDTDPRSLIIRVLAAAQRSRAGLNAEAIIEFLEESFGVFQQRQSSSQWSWNEVQLTEALRSLLSHKLVEVDQASNYRLTELGNLAGTAGVEVESIIRTVDALGSAPPDTINDPSLVAATQVTVELDQVYFPINKKSTEKEPQLWRQELRNQGIPASVARALERSVGGAHESTLRFKRAVACLLWVTEKSMAEIEAIMTQFGGKFDGAAGPVRGVRSRTCDLLPVVARVAEVLHPGLDLKPRISRLVIRLETGTPAAMVDLAARLGTRISRGDYQRLMKAQIKNVTNVEASSDDKILACIDGNKAKLAEIRNAVSEYREQEKGGEIASPILPAYDG
jgi:helicase